MQRVYNFAAGPAVMPAEALTTAANEMLCGMMPFSKIRRYYFTVCALLFVLLFVLMLARTGWRLTPQALLSTVVGWLLLCAVIIGVVYLVVSRRKTKGNGTDGGTERNV